MFDWLSKDIAVDLGTANTLVYVKGQGVVLNEPSVIAVRGAGERAVPIAYGSEANLMVGRTPEGVKTVRPIRTGVIADFRLAGLMLTHFMREALTRTNSLLRPRVVVGVPSGITEVEKRAIKESVGAASRDVRLVDEAMAAAIGCGLPVTEATANLVVDIGGGTTDVAVISLKDIVYSASVRLGGDALDEAIINYMRRQRKLLIGQPTAELIKKTIGSAHAKDDEQEIEVRGRSLTTGAPSSLVAHGQELREAMAEVVSAIVSAVRQALENTPPELAGDIISSGVALAGGGALIKGLDQRLSEELSIVVHIADDPLTAVVEGAGACLEKPELYRDVMLH
mgnify:CR=1 FL=1